MKIVLAFLLLLGVSFAQQHSPAYRSADRKIAAMDAYSASPAGGGLSTTLIDEEINAYFAEGGVKWPVGVSNVRIDDQNSIVTGSGLVDFDKITASSRSSNPLMALFSGVHTVRVIAKASGTRGRARVQVQSVTFDGMEIPRAALEFFVVKFLQPNYPEADLDAVFGMPNRVDSATVGDHQITFAQR